MTIDQFLEELKTRREKASATFFKRVGGAIRTTGTGDCPLEFFLRDRKTSSGLDQYDIARIVAEADSPVWGRTFKAAPGLRNKLLAACGLKEE